MSDQAANPRFSLEQIQHKHVLASKIRENIVRHLSHMPDIYVHGAQALNRLVPQSFALDTEDWDVVCQDPFERAKEMVQLLTFDHQIHGTKFSVQRRLKADCYEVVAISGSGPSTGAVILNLVDFGPLGPEHDLSSSEIQTVWGHRLAFLGRLNLITNLVLEFGLESARHRWTRNLQFLARLCTIDLSVQQYAQTLSATVGCEIGWFAKLETELHALYQMSVHKGLFTLFPTCGAKLNADGICTSVANLAEAHAVELLRQQDLQLYQHTHLIDKHETQVKELAQDYQTRLDAHSTEMCAKYELLLEQAQTQHAAQLAGQQRKTVQMRELNVRILKKCEELQSMCDSMVSKLKILEEAKDDSDDDFHLLQAYSILAATCESSDDSTVEQIFKSSKVMADMTKHSDMDAILAIKRISQMQRMLETSSKIEQMGGLNPKVRLSKILVADLRAAFERDGLSEEDIRDVVMYAFGNGEYYQDDTAAIFEDGSLFFETLGGMIIKDVFGGPGHWRRYLVESHMSRLGLPPGMIMIEQKDVDKMFSKNPDPVPPPGCPNEILPAEHEVCLTFSTSCDEWSKFVLDTQKKYAHSPGANGTEPPSTCQQDDENASSRSKQETPVKQESSTQPVTPPSKSTQHKPKPMNDWNASFEEFRSQLPMHSDPGPDISDSLGPRIRHSFGISDSSAMRVTIVPGSQTSKMLMSKIKTQALYIQEMQRRVKLVEGVTRMLAVRLYRLGENRETQTMLNRCLTEQDHKAHKKSLKKRHG